MQKVYYSDRVFGGTDHGVAPAGEGGLCDRGDCSDPHLFFMQEVKYEGDRTGQTENPIPDTAKNLRNQKRKAEEALGISSGYIRSAPSRSAFYLNNYVKNRTDFPSRFFYSLPNLMI